VEIEIEIEVERREKGEERKEKGEEMVEVGIRPWGGLGRRSPVEKE
jgi:hypothetical protein